MVMIYPADKHGRCLWGFCPTLCESEDAERTAFELASNMIKHGFKYDHIVIEED